MNSSKEERGKNRRILPAYPIFIIDPQFSLWSPSDSLNENDTVFWTGLKRRAYGLIRYGGKTYSFMGKRSGTVNLRQTYVNVTAFETQYEFECDEFRLIVKFVSPRLPTNLKIMSCPICYIQYDVKPSGKIPQDFSIAVVFDEEFCYNSDRAQVTGGVLPLDKYEAAFFTRCRNLVASNTSDTDAPDYGSTYLCGEDAFFVTENALNRYVYEGCLKYERNDDEKNFIIAKNATANGFFVTAFDDLVSIFYFGEWLKGYFF